VSPANVHHHRVDAGEVELDVEVAPPFVATAAVPPTVLLVSGLGSQRIDWPPELVEALRASGLRVVSYDQRDAGASTLLDDRPGEVEDLQRWLAREPFAVPYTLADMAADAVAVLDHLEVAHAHVVGRSMGGMIAQRLAASSPERVASLVSLQSTTGAEGVGRPWPEALAALAAPVPETREEVIEAGIARARVTGSPDLFDEERVRARLTAAHDRSHRPAGTTRQLLAILADGDRTPLLRTVTAPTLVIHGDQDTLVDVSGGVATAAAIPGAQLLLLERIGHDLPLPVLPTVAGAIVGHLWRAVED
jgi:pimeloyl-ACP methyl ester carboxylesterase